MMNCYRRARLALACCLSAFAFTANATAATKTWDGGAGTTSWHDDLNWSPDGAPAPGDDVTLSGAITVEHTTGVTDANEFVTQGGAVFILSGGTLNAAICEIRNARVEYFGGFLPGDMLLDDSALFVGPAATGAVQVVVVDNCALEGELHADQTITVQGNSTTGAASLDVTDIENRGTIRLESIDSAQACSLGIAANATFTNLADGEVSVHTGTGGSRLITGGANRTFRNHGLLNIEPGAVFASSGAGLMFEQLGGFVSAGGQLSIQNGGLSLQGGLIAAQVDMEDSTINVGLAGIASLPIVAVDDCTLLAMDAPGVTVWVQGNDTTGIASLDVSGITNSGTIRLESIDSGQTSRLVLDADASFTNASSGHIDVRAGTGGARSINGGGIYSVVNEGDITIEAGVELALFHSGLTLVQTDGTIGGDGVLDLTDATLLLHGGTVDANVSIDDGVFEVLAGITVSQPIIVVDNCTLLAQDAPGVTVWVQGNDTNGTASLDVSGITNSGTIRLESIDSGQTSRLVLDADASFTNASSGHIDVRAGTGGARSINGGGIYSVLNEGDMTIETGVELTLVDSGLTVLQAAGMIDGDGVLRVTNAALLLHGGIVDANVFIDDGAFEVLAGITVSQPITVVDNCTLLAQDAPGVTVWVQGNDTNGTASLDVSGTTNSGTIRLESIDSGQTSRLVLDADASFTNGPSGLVDVRTGAGGPRSINGNFINHGIVSPSYPDHLDITGSFVQSDTGTIVAKFEGETPGTYSFMDITGDADVDGSVRVSRLAGFTPTPGLELAILDCDGELTGTFTDILSCDPVNVVSNFDTDEVLVIFGEVSEVLGDLTGDGFVTVSDLLILIGQWGPCPGGELDCCTGDLDESGDTGVSDLLLLLKNWS